MALSNKRIAAVERLLPYWPPAHELPLYPAIHIDSPNGVRLLLERGADYRTVDMFGEGILHWIANSSLAMLRLFREIGVRGVDVGRRDNRGKTAVEIMEERWNLTKEFRREFMEFLDGVEEDVGRQRSGVAGGNREVAEVEDKEEYEDEELSENEFFDAQDSLTAPVAVLGERSFISVAKEPQSREPDSALELTDSLVSDSLALSPTVTEQQSLHRNCNEGQAHDEKPLACDLEIANGSSDERIPIDQDQHMRHNKGRREHLEHEDANETFHDSNSKEQKYPGTSNDVRPLEADKYFINEAGLKFLGTFAAMRDQ